MTVPALRLLAVDDDPLLLELLQRGLAHLGIEVQTAASPSDARAVLTRSTPDLVLLDVNIPGMSGADLAALVQSHPGARFVLFSAGDPSSLRSLASRVGAYGWVSKSAPLEDLGKELRRLHGRARAEAPAT